MNPSIIVAIPCYNEEKTIAKVVSDFRKVLPHAQIIVLDNNSSDQSVKLAQEAGATIVHVRQQGKGYVMQRMFEVCVADALIVVDGDDTYYAEDAPLLLEPVLKGQADMVVGNRLKHADTTSLVYLHQVGNRMIVDTINYVFHSRFEDILSGYRVFSPYFQQNVPLITPGFETETELTLQALEAGMIVEELPISYRSRPQDSKSKLRPFRDGLRIMMTAGMLLRDHYPLRLYGFVSIFCFLIALVAAVLKVVSYWQPLNISETLLAGLILLFTPVGAIALGIGLTLSAVNTRLKEMRQIMKRKKH